MSELSTMRFTKTISAPAADVYLALTNQAAITQWLCNDAHLSPRIGGTIFLNWNRPTYYTVGEITRLENNEVVEFTWHGRGEPAGTRVEIVLTEGEGRTELELAHMDVGSGEEWADTRNQIDRGWTFSLANLKQVLETGLDKRLYDRPFLGVIISSVVEEEEARELGPDVEGGIRISGTMDNTGASEAGLQGQDVIVRLGDINTKDLPSLQKVIQSHKAGDMMDLVFYRDGEMVAGKMKMSTRPHPEVPSSPAELAETLRQIYDDINDELDKIVSGSTEEAANYKAEAGKWSAKEILAHIVVNERALQIWTSSLIDKRTLQGLPNNPQAWIDSVAKTSTMKEVVSMLKHAESETVALLAHLPEDTVSRKATYFTIAETLLNFYPSHTRGHMEEIAEALHSAEAALI